MSLPLLSPLLRDMNGRSDPAQKADHGSLGEMGGGGAYK